MTHHDQTSPVLNPATALMEVAVLAARLVAPYLRDVARSAPDVRLKQDIHDPVTVHDQRVEGMIRDFLAKVAPDSSVLGEEMGTELDPELLGNIESYGLPDQEVDPTIAKIVADLGDRVRWIVDPIDGTANFAAGLTYFGSSIGVELDDEIVAGVVSVPFNYELFVGDDKHAWHEDEHTGNRSPLRSEGPSEEYEALVAAYYPNVHNLVDSPKESLDHEIEMFTKYSTIRRPGAGALDLAMVAAGWIGVSMATTFKPWDVAAGIHLVKIAGGRVLNLPMGTDERDGLRPGVVASVGTLHAVTAERILREVDSHYH